MILRRYGASFHSVALNFDSRAITDIGFRRDGKVEIPADDFADRWERVEGHELNGSAEGRVHDEVERELLAELASRIESILEYLDENEVLVVESQHGTDYPKTRSRQRNIIVEGENRLHFSIRVDPPLRVAVYRRRE